MTPALLRVIMFRHIACFWMACETMRNISNGKDDIHYLFPAALTIVLSHKVIED